jgi:hypothetical protein
MNGYGGSKKTNCFEMLTCAKAARPMWCYWTGLGFNPAKPFPYGTRYWCDDWCCVKSVHNATMTLCSFPFDAMELQIWDEMAKENPTPMSMLGLSLRMMNIVVTIVWIIIETSPTAVQLDAGSREMAMTVVSVLCQAALFVFEIYSTYKGYTRGDKIDSESCSWKWIERKEDPSPKTYQK